MQSKVSWFKRGIIAQDLRSVGWIGIIYQIALLFTLPLQLVMMHQADSLPYNFTHSQTNSLFSIVIELQILLMFTVPVILAVILFRYLQVKIPTDFIHSMPIKRTALLHHHALMGFFLLVVPVLVTAIFIAIVYGVLPLEQYFTIVEIAEWAGVTILMNIFVFVMTMLVGMVTGISAAQVILSYIFLIFPTGILFLFYINLKYVIYGFAYDSYLNQSVQYLTPIFQIVDYGIRGFTIKEVLVYIILTIAFYLLAIFTYKKRHIETATQAIAFRSLRPVFKYGVTFCMMLVSGMYFGETQQGSFGWLIFGYIFGSLFGYVIAEMVLQKTWRIFRSMKGYIIYVVAVVAVGFLLNLDVTGYEKKLPVAAEVERAYFADGVYFLKDNGERMDQGIVIEGSPEVSPVNEADRYYFTDPENINSIMKLHQQLVMNKNDDHSGQTKYKRSIAIAYELKNGSTFVRQYQIPEGGYQEFLKPIYESEEHRNSFNDLLRLKEGLTIDKVMVTSNSVFQKSFETVDPQQIQEMMNALKSDMMQEPYEEMFSERDSWGDIELLLKNNQRLGIPWKKSYHQFDKWLADNNLQEKARVVPTDIDYALVAPIENGAEAVNKMQEELLEQMKNNPATLKITDPKQLEECLYETAWLHEKGEYLIAIYYKHRSEADIRSLVDVPPAIAEQF
ncbi:multidrug ABC transporter permease [Schinkia sp. CFF1]